MDSLDILIKCPSAKNSAGVRISLQSRGERYFDSERFYLQTFLTNNKMYIGSIFPEWREVGPVTIWVDVENVGEVSTTVFVTSGTKASGDIEIVESNSTSKEISWKGSIHPLPETSDEPIFYTVYCTRCGIPVFHSKTKLENNYFHIKIPLGENVFEHNNNLLFHFHKKNSRYSVVYNLKSKYKSLSFTQEPELNPEEPFVLPLSKEKIESWKGSRAFYLLTQSPAISSQFLHHIQSSPKSVHRGAVSNFERKESALEIAQTSGEVLLFQNHSELQLFEEVPTFQIMLPIEYQDIVIPIPTRYRTKDLYLSILLLEKDGIRVYLQKYYPVSKQPCIVIDSPKALFPKESVEVDLFTIPEKDVTVYRVDKGQKEKLLKMGDRYTQRIVGEKEYHFELQTSEGIISKNLNLPQRDIQETSIELVEKNHTFVVDNLTKHFPNPNSLIQEICPNYILAYVWGCAEQTSAKLAALGFLLKSTDNKDFYITRITEGLEFLKSYQNEEGYMQYFKSTEHDIKSTAAVYVNLSLLSAFRKQLEPLIPEYFQFLDRLAKIVKDYKTDRTGRQDHSAQDLFINPENLKELVKWENDHFHLVKEGFYSVQALLYYSLAHLLQKEKNELEVFGSYKKLETKVYSLGLKGMLEKWNILKPKLNLELQLKTKKIDNAKEKIKEQLNLRFLKDSFPSTYDMIALVGLLHTVQEKVPKYEYTKPNGKEELKVQSDWTFIIRDSSLEPSVSSSSAALKIQKLDLAKGERLVIKWIMQRHIAINNYYLYLPSLFALPFWSEENKPIRLNPSFGKEPIKLESIRKGVGRILLLEESAYMTSQRKVFDLGTVRVE